MGNLNISSLSLSLFPSFLPFQQAGIPPSPSFSYASSIHPGPSLTPPHPHPPTQPSPAPTHRYLLTTKMTLAWNMRSHLFSTETFSVFLEEAFFFFSPGFFATSRSKRLFWPHSFLLLLLLLRRRQSFPEFGCYSIKQKGERERERAEWGREGKKEKGEEDAWLAWMD